MNIEFIFSEIFSDFHNYNRVKKEGLYKFFNNSEYKYFVIEYLVDIASYCDNEKMAYEYLLFCAKLDVLYTNHKLKYRGSYNNSKFLINILLNINDPDKLEEFSNSLEDKKISQKFRKKMSVYKIIPYKRTSSLGM